VPEWNQLPYLNITMLKKEKCQAKGMSLYFSHVINYNFYSTVCGKKTFSMGTVNILKNNTILKGIQ
jgi:hypothetical protein